MANLRDINEEVGRGERHGESDKVKIEWRKGGGNDGDERGNGGERERVDGGGMAVAKIKREPIGELEEFDENGNEREKKRIRRLGKSMSLNATDEKPSTSRGVVVTFC